MVLMKQDNIKAMIWQLDGALDIFSGLDWIANVGRVARLKDSFFRLDDLEQGVAIEITGDQAEELVGYLEALSGRVRGATGAAQVRARAFEQAVGALQEMLNIGERDMVTVSQ